MDLTTIIGLVAAAFTTIAYVPQAIKTIKTKDTRSISTGMYVLFTMGSIVWAIYGFMSHNMPVIAANVITSILSLIILFYKLTSKNNGKQGS